VAGDAPSVAFIYVRIECVPIVHYNLQNEVKV